ncbi:choice-of-anchor D domain-containing protein [Frankia sp. Cas3]|uniref:choice-of-anchor D domain-containing protein n=1 Tax=Frankia sp. Cas3 TaxID=3073926 RepID=UPI002AD3AF4E|nr:choice-of-anchor D domain-containing protein [Frankia sp. Cas3]
MNFRSLPRKLGAFAVALATVSAYLVAVPGLARSEVLTVSQDALRTGWDQAEPGLSPSSVSASDFGELYSVDLDGSVYGEPVIAGGTVVVTTENNNVYGIDEVTGLKKWSMSVGAPWPPSVIGCGDVGINIGITSTPVVDKATNTVYLTAKVNDGGDVQHPHYYMHALDLTTGAERSGWPATIQGAPSNDPAGTPFDARVELQRPGLLLLNGVVYAAFGGHCDIGKYRGYVVGVSTTTAKLTTMWASEATGSDIGGGIWQSGGGLISDGPGRIILTTGNGVSPAPGPGSSVPGQLAEAVVRLGVGADGRLSTQDFFTPVNAATLNQNDTDLGSGGPLALPDGFGTPTHPHLLVQDGKDGRVFLLDRDDLGGRGQGPQGIDDVVGMTGPFQGVWGHPALWGGDGGYVYLAGSGGPLRALKYGLTGAGEPALTAAGTSSGTFPFGSGSPTVTSDGTTSGSALVWMVYESGASGSNGQLRAYDAVPTNGVLTQRFSAPIGIASKFTKVATDANRVFVGTRDGHLLAFGRPTGAVLYGSATDFGKVPVGVSATATAQVTARVPLTVSAISTSAPFAATLPTLPVTLAAGATLSVPVTFTPTAPVATDVSLTFTTDTGLASIDLRGIGTQAGLGADPPSLAFDRLSTGGSSALSVNIVNTGTAATTITGATLPGDPFAVSGLPAPGTTIPAGGSVTASVTFAPTTAGTFAATLTVTSADGPVSVALSGSAVTGAPKMTISPMSLDFGQVPQGQARTATFDVRNDGNLPLTITKAKAPVGDFASTQISEGLTLAPGEVIHQSVTFTPTSTGVQAGSYILTGDDGAGVQTVTLSGEGTSPDPNSFPPPSQGKWTLNGTAAMSGGDLVLTPTQQYKAGSAVYPVTVSTDRLAIEFTAQIGGGTGGDGQTFALLDATKTTDRALGTNGGSMGFGTLPGVAVALDTYTHGNSLAVATGTSGGSSTYVARTTNVPHWRDGTHVVDVVVTGGRVQVAVDGQAKLDVAVAVPANALLAFTGSTGSVTDLHVVRDVTISRLPSTPPPLTAPGWSRNGSATLSGSDLVLTPAAQNRAGSSFYGTPQPTAGGLHATFTVQIGGGTGADGLTYALLDAANAGPTALGKNGGGLGFSGLAGFAVTLATYRGGAPSHYVSVVRGAAGTPPVVLASSTKIGDLRTGTHLIDVEASGGRIVVAVDGITVIDTAADLPSNVLLGFTAGTGSRTDVHTVRNVTITHG